MANSSNSVIDQRSESPAERHGWKLLLGLSSIVTMFGVGDAIKGGSTLQNDEAVLMQGVTGTTWQELRADHPRIANLIDTQIRAHAVSLLVLGLLSATVSLTGLRRGERWAWYAMWIWPLWSASAAVNTLKVDKVPGAGTPVPAISGSIFTVLSALTLILSYRKYF
jgi:hypothetical protein